MQNQLVQFASNHPIAVTAAAAATALLFFLQRHYKKQNSEKESFIKLTNQGPEFQIVQAIELMGRYYNLNCTKTLSSSSSGTTKQVSGLSRFFFRRDEVGQFFNKNEHDLQSFFPIAETLSSIHSILADAANEAQLIEKRRKESFDDKNQEHIEMLKKLWRLGIVDHDDDDVGNNDTSIAFERHSSKWDKLGFQGQDPATDLRAGGVLALEMFVSFVEKNVDLVKMMQRHNVEQHREGGLNWMLIACASIHITVTLFKQIGDGNNSNGFSVWTRPLLMAIYRGSAIMKFHPKAKVPDSERAGFMPTPRDYHVGLVRVVAVSEAMLKDESTHSLSEDFDISAAVANSPERNRKGDDDENNTTNLLLSSSSSSSSTYPRVRTGRMQKWSLYSSICRVHHFLMRRLFEEWIEKKPSVMEFETFIVKNVYEPFFLSENPVLL